MERPEDARVRRKPRNIAFSGEEFGWLKAQARRGDVSVAQYVRHLVHREMGQAQAQKSAPAT